MDKVVTKALVDVRLSVQASSRWNEDAAMKQIKKQATEEVLQMLTRELGEIAGIRVIGKPMVTAVLVNEDEEIIVDDEVHG